jgi:hypothetical protein
MAYIIMIPLQMPTPKEISDFTILLNRHNKNFEVKK